jgi:hypothetical protein
MSQGQPVVQTAGVAPQAIDFVVCGWSVLGPGLSGRESLQALLRDAQAWQRMPATVPTAACLPATERRRASLLTKAAIAVAEQAVQAAGLAASELASVFASATGDATNCDALCQSLAEPAPVLSPTRFTNSVHNAAAGFWHIVAGATRPSTSLAAHEGTAGVALLEALAQMQQRQEPVLLVVCDQAMPAPLLALRPIPDLFGFAAVLAPMAVRSAPGSPNSHEAATAWRAQLEDDGSAPGTGTAATALPHARLEALRREVPAARALPWLLQLLQHQPRTVTLELTPGLSLRLQPLVQSAA